MSGADRGILITPHFSWAEVTRSKTAREKGIVNELPAALIANVVRTAHEAEVARALLGVPMAITSWYRSSKLNRAVGGSATSAHMQGLAIDFKPVGLTFPEAFERLAASSLPFDQLIHEQTRDGARWIHLGFSLSPPRREVLRASGAALGGDMQFRRVAAG